MAKEKKEEKCSCGCENENCNCKNDCNCREDCCCESECNCKNDCHKDDQMQEEFNYLEMAQRIKADFDNYRKRTKENEKKAKEDGIILAVEKLLPIVDSLESAKKQVKDKNFLKSIEMINSQLEKCFESLNIKKIEALGKTFDPNFHNAVFQGEEKDKEPDEILEVFQEGFMFNGKVIRHSVVKVNK